MPATAVSQVAAAGERAMREQIRAAQHDRFKVKHLEDENKKQKGIIEGLVAKLKEFEASNQA